MFLWRFARSRGLFTRKATAVAGVAAVAVPGGAIISKKDAEAVQASNLCKAEYRTRYVSEAYLDCIRKFNSAQIDAKEPVTSVQCKGLDEKEREAMKSSLAQAGFLNYRVNTVSAMGPRDSSYTVVFVPQPRSQEIDEADEADNRMIP
jgi:hypothetical protein